MYSAWQNIPKYRAHIQRSNVYERKNQCRTKCTIGQDFMVSSNDRLPLVFQVCSVHLSETECRSCWSREPARQSTALRVCSAPVPSATEKQQWWRLLLSTTSHRPAGRSTRETSDLPPASRCESAPLSASVSRSCWFRAPSRPWPARTGWNGPGAHQMIRYYCSTALAITFLAFNVHGTLLLQSSCTYCTCNSWSYHLTNSLYMNWKYTEGIVKFI